MTSIKLTQQMKRYTVIVALKAENSDLDITRFLNVARSVKIRKELKVSDRDTTALAEPQTSVINLFFHDLCVFY